MNLDCYVRIADNQLPRIRLIHLQSGVDDDESMDEHKLKGEGALLTCEISGYTEWVGESVPATSLGWDWVMAPPAGELMVRAGSIRTNIMLVDEQGADCGLEATVQACGRLLAQWTWQPEVLAAIGASTGANTTTGAAGAEPGSG